MPGGGEREEEWREGGREGGRDSEPAEEMNIHVHVHVHIPALVSTCSCYLGKVHWVGVLPLRLTSNL